MSKKREMQELSLMGMLNEVAESGVYEEAKKEVSISDDTTPPTTDLNKTTTHKSNSQQMNISNIAIQQAPNQEVLHQKPTTSNTQKSIVETPIQPTSRQNIYKEKLVDSKIDIPTPVKSTTYKKVTANKATVSQNMATGDYSIFQSLLELGSPNSRGPGFVSTRILGEKINNLELLLPKLNKLEIMDFLMTEYLKDQRGELEAIFKKKYKAFKARS